MFTTVAEMDSELFYINEDNFKKISSMFPYLYEKIKI